jgi:hypothetical protein
MSIQLDLFTHSVGPVIEAPTDADWLDNMILIGRMYIGEAPSDHARVCLSIQSDRMTIRLIQRLRLKARAACQ